MYGSQFQAELALTCIRPSTQALANKTFYISKSKINRKKIFGFMAFALIVLSISSLSFAGSSQPRLRGGNGNANGR